MPEPSEFAPASQPAASPAATRPRAVTPVRNKHTLVPVDPVTQAIWNYANASPMRSLWKPRDVSWMVIVKRTIHAFIEDDLVSRAAELGYFFFLALFPALIAVSSILGLIAKSGNGVEVQLLNYLAVVVPPSAMSLVLTTVNETAVHSSGGKVTFGILVALWSASVGFSAIQDIMNTVYKTRETRPYWKAKGASILVTILLAVLMVVLLAFLLMGTYLAHLLRHHTPPHTGYVMAIGVHLLCDALSLGVLMVLFAVIFYYAPDVEKKSWRWLSPGAALAIVCWVLASVALRIYLHYFNSYSATYGSLGAVIILLTWFYITGLALLLGAEFNSEIQVSVAEQHMKKTGQIDSAASADPEAAIV